MHLALDTSTSYASLALVQGYTLLAETTWLCGSNHSVELSPRLQEMLSRSRCDIRSLDCVIVAIGPGSFNGLRVGVSEAKGIAFSLGIPIIGISSLESSAYQYGVAGLPVCALQNAGREEVAAAIFQRKPRKGWTRLLDEHITTVEQLAGFIKSPTVFCGELSDSLASELKKIFKSRALIPSPSGRLRRIGCLAELGHIRFEKGLFDNLAGLQPLYLRRPPITERKKPF